MPRTLFHLSCGLVLLFSVTSIHAQTLSLIHRNTADSDMSVYSFVFSRDGKKIYAGASPAWSVGDQSAPVVIEVFND